MHFLSPPKKRKKKLCPIQEEQLSHFAFPKVGKSITLPHLLSNPWYTCRILPPITTCLSVSHLSHNSHPAFRLARLLSQELLSGQPNSSRTDTNYYSLIRSIYWTPLRMQHLPSLRAFSHLFSPALLLGSIYRGKWASWAGLCICRMPTSLQNRKNIVNAVDLQCTGNENTQVR